MEPGPPPPQPPVTLPPYPPGREKYGSVLVRWETSGDEADIDIDGYVLQVDGYWDYTHPDVGIGHTGKVMLHWIAEGEHSLTVRGVAANCTGEQLEDRPFTAVGNSVVTVEFHIVCRPR